MAEYTENPFRAMDEYDVFMDDVNRKLSTETLLQFAWDQRDKRQYILLTPQVCGPLLLP